MARRPWWALALGTALLVVSHAWRSEADHDEIEHLHAAWLVGDGASPYADFFEHHPPVLWWLLAPATRAITSVHALVFAARLVDLALMIATLWFVGRIARRLSPQVPRRWPVVLLLGSGNFVRSSMEVRPDPLMCLLVIVGLDLWLGYVERPRAWRAVVGGLALGASAAVLQKALVAVALLSASGLLLAVLRRDERSKARALVSGAALLVAAAAVPVGALVAHLAAREQLAGFWFWNFTYNRYLHWSVPAPDALTLVDPFIDSLGDAPLLWLVGIAGVRRTFGQLRDDRRVVMLVMTLGSALFIVSNLYLCRHYFLLVLPLLAILAAERFVAWERRLKVVALALLALPAYRLMVYPDFTQQHRVQEYVLTHSTRSETVLVSPPYHPIFRRDASYFWFGGPMLQGPYEALCDGSGCAPRHDELDRERWCAAPPTLVFLDPRYTEYHPLDWATKRERCRVTELPTVFRCRQ